MTVQTTRIDIEADDRVWLQSFKKLNHLHEDREAITKLIEMHKAWNDKIGDSLERISKGKFVTRDKLGI